MAPIRSGHHGPDADGAPEVLRDVCWNQFLHTDVEVLVAMDLEAGDTEVMLSQS